MPFIQVRNVSEELREAAKQRAAALGVDLSTYVRRLVERDLAKPSMTEWLDGVLATPTEQRFDAAHAVRDAREDRDRRIAESLGW